MQQCHREAHRKAKLLPGTQSCPEQALCIWVSVVRRSYSSRGLLKRTHCLTPSRKSPRLSSRTPLTPLRCLSLTLPLRRCLVREPICGRFLWFSFVGGAPGLIFT